MSDYFDFNYIFHIISYVWIKKNYSENGRILIYMKLLVD